MRRRRRAARPTNHKGTRRVPFLRSLGDSIRFDALRADAHPAHGAVHHGADALEVRIPAPGRLVVRVADVVSRDGTLATNLTHSSHSSIRPPMSSQGAAKRPKPKQPTEARQPRKTAVITGVTGQDGSYLAELLLAKGYEVIGNVRQGGRDAAARVDSVLSALALRRRQSLRALDHRELSRVLRHVRGQRHPVQPRIAAAR